MRGAFGEVKVGPGVEVSGGSCYCDCHEKFKNNETHSFGLWAFLCNFRVLRGR